MAPSPSRPNPGPNSCARSFPRPTAISTSSTMAAVSPSRTSITIRHSAMSGTTSFRLHARRTRSSQGLLPWPGPALPRCVPVQARHICCPACATERISGWDRRRVWNGRILMHKARSREMPLAAVDDAGSTPMTSDSIEGATGNGKAFRSSRDPMRIQRHLAV